VTIFSNVIMIITLSVWAVVQRFVYFFIIIVALYVYDSFSPRTKDQRRPVAPPVEVVNLAPGQTKADLGGRTVSLGADRGGHYTAGMEINGSRVNMLVDTGATTIALAATDAARAGQFPSQNDFRVRVSTANGIVLAAPVRLREVRLEGIVLRDVDALIMPPGNLSTSLLGMSFLKRLASFQIANGRLVLTQ
jgi:aspartyl protease family protein